MTDAIDMASLDSWAPDASDLVAEAPAGDEPRDAWLRRRATGFGASEIAPLLVSLGMRSPDVLASWQRPDAAAIRVRLGRSRREKAVAVPRILLAKAGLRRPRKLEALILEGQRREPELVATWRRMLAEGRGGPTCALIDPASVIYVPEVLPAELLPLRDAEQPRLTCTPDVLARDVLSGALGAVDTKCSVEPYGRRYRGAPEHQRIQVCAQLAVCCGEWGAVVEGEGWAAVWRDDGLRGPVVTWPVERDETLIDEIRRACALGWERVCELTEAAKEMA